MELWKLQWTGCRMTWSSYILAAVDLDVGAWRSALLRILAVLGTRTLIGQMVFGFGLNNCMSNHALQRTRRERRGCHRGVPCAGSLSLGRSAKMRHLFAIILLLSLCGCTSEEERFRRDMQQRYEATCDQYFSIYASSDNDGAKKALGQIIDLSLSEKGKARHYWRFNLLIAYSQARLAVIAESEGKKVEAE